MTFIGSLNKTIANLFGYFFCPVCERIYRKTMPVRIGGHVVCEQCGSLEITRRITGWYGDFK